MHVSFLTLDLEVSGSPRFGSIIDVHSSAVSVFWLQHSMKALIWTKTEISMSSGEWERTLEVSHSCNCGSISNVIVSFPQVLLRLVSTTEPPLLVVIMLTLRGTIL